MFPARMHGCSWTLRSNSQAGSSCTSERPTSVPSQATIQERLLALSLGTPSVSVSQGRIVALLSPLLEADLTRLRAAFAQRERLALCPVVNHIPGSPAAFRSYIVGGDACLVPTFTEAHVEPDDQAVGFNVRMTFDARGLAPTRSQGQR